MTSTTDLIDSAIWSLSLDDKIKVWELIEQLIKESQLPQQEISDEEIMKGAKEWYNKEGAYSASAIALKTWVFAIKWYREKLKQPKKD
jgi:hypothetical protein